MHYTPIQPAEKAVRKIIMWYRNDNGQLLGLELFDRDGLKILETKQKWNH
jgi:hypothetical protein